MNNVFGLTGKSILVTGASSGIGRSIATECAAQGAAIVLTGRNQDRLAETKKLLPGNGHKLIAADLVVDEELDVLVDQLPLLDGLVLNAGIVKIAPVKFLKKDNIDLLFRVNVESAVLLVQKILKQKKMKAGGSICFISSVATQKITPGNSLYSATKGAVNSFAKALALELAPSQIRVNAILPGLVKTNILNEVAVGAEELELHKSNYPIGRFGKPEDVAYLCVYLMSDASQWMTGSLLTIDGGYSIK